MTVTLHLKSASMATQPPAPLWLVDLDQVSTARQKWFADLLDPAERERAGRFGFRDRRLQHIVAHGLKRLVLAKIARARPDTLRFGLGNFGKPQLLEHPSIDFSLAHCDGLAGIAVSTCGPVGLDLERRDRAIDDRVAARYLSVSEQAAASNADRVRLWTLKEAYVKATGRGMTEAFDSFTVALDPPRIDNMRSCTAWQGLVGQNHIAAVVLIEPSR